MAVESLGPDELRVLADSTPDADVAPARVRVERAGSGLTVTHRFEVGLVWALTWWACAIVMLLVLVVQALR